MSGEAGDRHYHWCLRHNRVESGDDVCPAKHRLGPFPTKAGAELALEKVRERNEEWEAEDARWEREKD